MTLQQQQQQQQQQHGRGQRRRAEVMYGILFRFVISFLNLAEIDERTNQKDKRRMNFSSLNADVASSVVINLF